MNAPPSRPARRRLLAVAGLTAAGLASAGLTAGFIAGCALPVFPRRPAPGSDDAAGWIQYAAGRYTLWLPRVEMGQNIGTALKQIACEELGIDWHALDVKLPDTQQISRVRATVGSESVRDFAVPLAHACAALREALAGGLTQQQMAAQRSSAPPLRSLNGSAGRFVGRSPRAPQAEAIVRGQPLFAADQQRPGLCYGRVLRAAASPELHSELIAIDEAAARAVPGFVALVRDSRLTQMHAAGIGIVARTPAALDRIERSLAPRWRVDRGVDAAQIDSRIDAQADSPPDARSEAAIDVDRRLRESRSLAHRLHGDPIDTAAPWDVDLRIDVPLAAHAAIEPRAAVAEFDAAGRLQLWVGSQDVFYQRDVMMRRFGLSEDQVVVHACRVGGAFGGKTLCSVELEAALLAHAVKRPVKVQWTRAQEFAFAFHRPPSSHRIRARLRDGRLHDWWHAFASSHIIFTSAGFPPWLQRLADFAGDPGVARGAMPPYRAAARRVEFDTQRIPVHTGPWRGLGATPNIFAIECAIDECARAAGVDPVPFRLAHIDDPRLRRVLQRCAEAAGTPPAASHAGIRRGRGVACGIYKEASYAAVVADIAVDTVSGDVTVTRLVCAHDCGRVINPDQVRAQCEGNLVWGLGMVLVERLPLAAAARIAASSFADSPIPSLPMIPPMQVLLVDENDPPSGAGETVIIAAGAAIANALRDAVGFRLTRLPLQAAEFRDALAPHRPRVMMHRR